MSTQINYPWMQTVKPKPTAEQAALIEDLRRVANGAQNALQAFSETSCGGEYETEAWRATYDKLEEVADTAHFKWSEEFGKYSN